MWTTRSVIEWPSCPVGYTEKDNAVHDLDMILKVPCQDFRPKQFLFDFVIYGKKLKNWEKAYAAIPYSPNL